MQHRAVETDDLIDQARLKNERRTQVIIKRVRMECRTVALHERDLSPGNQQEICPEGAGAGGQGNLRAEEARAGARHTVPDDQILQEGSEKRQLDGTFRQRLMLGPLPQEGEPFGPVFHALPRNRLWNFVWGYSPTPSTNTLWLVTSSTG